MERIGDDELLSIFFRFDNVNDQKSFSLVSKQFLKVACIRRRILRSWLPDLLYDILPASPNLVKFYCSKSLSNNHMKLLAQSCCSLVELKLGRLLIDSEFDFDDDGLCAVATACSHLVTVDLSRRLHIGDAGIHSLIKSCKNLRYLNLSGCVNVMDESLKVIGESSSLVNLDLRRCYLYTDLGLSYLANGEVRKWLFTLHLSKTNRISDNAIIYLEKIAGLIVHVWG